MARLSNRFITSLETPDKEAVHWDDDLPGFGLRVRSSGKMTFICQFRNSQGRIRKITLGAYGRMTPHEARIEARSVLAAVDKGEDPAANRDAVKKAPTMKEFAERYLREHAALKKKARSISQDKSMLDNIILPALGNQKLQGITRNDVTRLHYSLRKTPYRANRVLALLSKMFNLAERWGLRPDGSNPCRHVEKFKEKKRERYLSSEELSRLGNTLAQAEREGKELPSVITAIRLLILTGARLSEILDLRWEWVDFEHGCLRLPDSKTGAKLIPLSRPAYEILENLPRLMGNPYVIPGAKEGEHLVNLNKPWRRIRKRARLDDVRIHDLRHSFASVAAASGMGLPVIGALLGHKEASTTQRYTHLANDPLKAAADMVAQKITEAMNKPPSKKVVRLPRKD